MWAVTRNHLFPSLYIEVEINCDHLVGDILMIIFGYESIRIHVKLLWNLLLLLQIIISHQANYGHKPWSEPITSTVEVWGWISNFSSHFIMDVMTVPCWDLSKTKLVKWAHSLLTRICITRARWINRNTIHYPYVILGCMRQRRMQLSPGGETDVWHMNFKIIKTLCADKKHMRWFWSPLFNR